ncbi:carboxymuconolactone decarboxylase family protein [Streptomyces endophyticus]|uniref:Carboxymuconolactone decarboxylase family protein n=1 Tax=Streptomyces endophyticus TaxID=714166 RepID=A0ABU6F8B2_9ACTN|nr:carboxymuconolactone decarboxylase family protein [Streptomyces endophyticus]MEB8340267.1 carboxymuconolactone decarboxylase family protein [Streptomyces endophyticus]
MPLKSKQPRIEPLSPPYDEEAGEALELLGHSPIQLFRVWARRPELARSIAGWGSYYLSRRSALTLRQRELVIDRTTALCGADYEWAVHIASFARKAELDAAQLTSLANGGPADGCWDTTDRAVLEAVDELHTTFDLSDDAWTDLVTATDEDAALDLVLICGWYHAISFAVRALRLPLEPDTEPIAAH